MLTEWLLGGALVVSTVGGLAALSVRMLRDRTDPRARVVLQRRAELRAAGQKLPLSVGENGDLDGIVDGRRVRLSPRRVALERASVPSDCLGLQVMLDDRAAGGLRLQSRPGGPVPGERVPGVAVSAEDPAQVAAVLARDGVRPGILALAARGALTLDGRWLTVSLPVTTVADDVADLAAQAVALVRLLERQPQQAAGGGGVEGVAASLGLTAGAPGEHVGTWRGRTLRLVAGAQAVELRLDLNVVLPGDLVIVGRDAPPPLTAAAGRSPVPLPLGSAMLPMAVGCSEVDFARSLFRVPGLPRALEGVVDDRGSRVQGNSVVRVVLASMLDLSAPAALGRMETLALQLEAAVMGVYTEAAARCGLEVWVRDRRPALRGTTGGVALVLEPEGAGHQLRAWPASGAWTALHMRARTKGAPSKSFSGDPIVDGAVTVEGVARVWGLRADLVLPLVCGRGARVDAGVLQVCVGSPTSAGVLAELLDDAVALAAVLVPKG